MREYSEDLAALKELKMIASQKGGSKPRGVYKCGQCGMPKIRPHKCELLLRPKSCSPVNSTANGPFIVSPVESPSKRLQLVGNPRTTTSSRGGGIVGRPAFPSDQQQQPSMAQPLFSRSTSFESGITSFREQLLSSNGRPTAGFGGARGGHVVEEEIVLLPTSNSHLESNTNGDRRDLLCRYNQSNKEKIKKTRTLLRKANNCSDGSAPAAGNKRFAIIQHQQSSDSEQSYGWSETTDLVPQELPLLKRARSANASFPDPNSHHHRHADSSHYGLTHKYCTNNSGSGGHYHQHRSCTSACSTMSESASDLDSQYENSDSEGVGGGGGGGGEQMIAQFAAEYTSRRGGMVAEGHAAFSYESVFSVIDRLALNDDAMVGRQQRSSLRSLAEAALPCETIVSASNTPKTSCSDMASLLHIGCHSVSVPNSPADKKGGLQLEAAAVMMSRSFAVVSASEDSNGSFHRRGQAIQEQFLEKFAQRSPFFTSAATTKEVMITSNSSAEDSVVLPVAALRPQVACCRSPSPILETRTSPDISQAFNTLTSGRGGAMVVDDCELLHLPAHLLPPTAGGGHHDGGGIHEADDEEVFRFLLNDEEEDITAWM